ncbi:hypothetical protein [Candidatus Endomicrobiellum trichonymphae]|nr:hypothetical protein [Candidatus Endomicrobium trichonymphae]
MKRFIMETAKESLMMLMLCSKSKSYRVAGGTNLDDCPVFEVKDKT